MARGCEWNPRGRNSPLAPRASRQRVFHRRAAGCSCRRGDGGCGGMWRQTAVFPRRGNPGKRRGIMRNLATASQRVPRESEIRNSSPSGLAMCNGSLRGSQGSRSMPPLSPERSSRCPRSTGPTSWLIATTARTMVSTSAPHRNRRAIMAAIPIVTPAWAR